MTALALLLALAAQDQTGEPGAWTAMGLRVEVDALWAHPAIGFPYPLRVRIENHGPARLIECEVDGSDMGWEETLGWNSRRSLRLGEMEKVNFSLLVPATTGQGTLRFRVNGAEVPSLGRAIHSAGGLSQHLVVDHRRTFTQNDLETAFGKGQNYYASGGSRGVVLSPERLSGEWQAYAGLAGVWIQARDWKQASPAAREAILRAAKAGQQVLFYNLGSVTLEAAAFEGRKNGWAEPLSKEGRGIADEGFAFGFGKILGLRGEATSRADMPARCKMDGPGLLDAHFTAETATIPGVGDPPRMTFFWIVLAFAFFLGPVNLMIVSRVGRRVLFLVTTPILALFAVTVLVTYSAVHEGFGIHGNVRTIGFLDPDEKELVLCSSVSVYSGVHPGRWTYRPETLCMDTASRRTSHDPYGNRSPRSYHRTAEADWSQGQNISGSWVPSRELRGLNTAQVVPCRGRLVLERGPEGRIRLHNALGADILSGHLKFDGRWHAIPAVAEGATGEVQERSHPPEKNWFTRPETLPEGGFEVNLKEAPELDLAGKKITMAVSLHVLRGRVSETR